MRAVQVQPHAEQLIAQKADRTQSGLLLGQSWDPTRVYVLAAVPTPPVPKSASGGGGGWNKTEWFLEHARQVRRMLVGGVELIGMYVADTNAERLRAFDADGALRDMVYGLPLSACSVDRILLRGGGKSLSGESYTGAKKDGVKPKPLSNIKVTSVSSSLLTLETTLQVDVSVPVQPASAGVPLKQQLRKGLEPFQASVLAAQATFDGHTLDSALVLDKVFELDAGGAAGSSKSGKARGKTSRKPAAAAAASASAADAAGVDEQAAHQVELFLRPTLLPAPAASSEGVVRIRGACHCRVYAHSRSTVAQALLALKHDIIWSLQARLQLVAEDSEDAQGSFDLPSASHAAAASSAVTWSMPRRLFQPVAPPAAVCDYLFPHEVAADGVRRIQEMLGEQSLDEAREAGNAEAFTHERADDTDALHIDDALADVKATAASAQQAGPAGSATKSADSKARSNLLLPVAFGVLAVALSIAFLTQVM